jgi:putative transposase
MLKTVISHIFALEAGRSVAEMAREVGVSHHTICAWKAKYGGMEVKEAEELRSLRQKNHRSKKLVADLSLDKDMLKSVIKKNGYSSRV